MGAAVVGVTWEILCTTFFARTGMKTRAFMRYSAHVGGFASRSESPTRGCAASADPGATRAVTLHRKYTHRHAGAVTIAGARDRASEAAAGQAASHAVWAQVGEADAADRAVGAATGGTGIEAQRARGQRASTGSRHRPLRLLRQRNPRAAPCPIICRDKHAGTSRKKRYVRNAMASCAS